MDHEEDGLFTDNLSSLRLKKEDEEEDNEEEEGEDEEEDARIFDTWMNRYRSTQKSQGEEEDSGIPKNVEHTEKPQQMRIGRRASLPCPATLSEMQLSRLHTTTCVPVTAKVLLRRSSSRRLVPPTQDDSMPTPAPERKSSLIPSIPEAVAPEKRSVQSQFRRRNVMSLSDADSICMICHDDLNRGTGGARELQCSHTFHKECIEEWLWKKQSCPTCQVQVFMPQPLYWSATRVKVP